MTENSQSVSKYADSLNALTLPLQETEAPFALSKEERKFGPSDWAWLFLSLNPEYRNAYSNHVNDEDIELSAELAGRQPLGLKADHDGECRERFGLSVWIPPSLMSPPCLANEDASFFFPLIRFITEDSQTNAEHDFRHPAPNAPPGVILKKQPHIIANAGMFGYLPPLNVRLPHTFKDTPNNPLSPKHNISSWSNLWVAIDCSIPPGGQIMALRTLAEATYTKLKEDGGWEQHDGFWDCGIEAISHRSVFANLVLPPAYACTGEAKDPRSLWRAAVIDPLGAIGQQIELLSKDLQKVHRDLVSKKHAKKPMFERFPNTLPSTQDNDGIYRNGGSYLKALFTLAELSDRGQTDQQEIARTLGVYSSNNRYPFNWMREFHFNIPDYLEKANQMVTGGYRFLIQAQKPNT